MNDLLEQFIECMVQNDCAPENISDIKADNLPHYYKIKGDESRQKRASYCIEIRDEFSVGWIRNHKIGETISWNSRCKNDTRTPAEKAAWKAKIDAARAAQDIENERKADQAAIKANDIWSTSSVAGDHPYLNRKQIKLNGARIHNNKIVIPAYKNDKIRTIQTIDNNGSKLFLSCGEKKGCYFPIGFTDFPETIVICEGYATGCSLYDAKEYPVAVAFDAGNLKPVLASLRKKYKNTNFIIAADNDAFTIKPKFKPVDINYKELSADSDLWLQWKSQGHLFNTGIEKATAACKGLDNVRIMIPRFNDITTKPTDFNDLHVLEGVDAIRTIFDTPLEDESGYEESDSESPSWLDEIPFPEDEESRAIVSLYATNETRSEVVDWKSKLHLSDKGVVIASSLHNTMLFIENEKVLKNIFCYDEFSCKKVVYQCPPWNDPKTFSPRNIDDDDITFLTAYLERFGIKIGSANVGKCLKAAVKKNPKNPAKEYFKSLKWDGVPRLDNWLRDFCGCTVEDNDYVSAVGRKWMCAAIKRIFYPGTKYDHMLVLEGEQGTKKSSILKELATIHGTAYFNDTIDVPSLGTFNAIMKFQGTLIVEIAELSGIQKKDVNELKNQITICDDEVVLKYENEPTLFPRKFVFAGTINPTGGGYLSDPTGGRRFQPVTTTIIDVEGLSKVKEQLWAEAYVAMENGEKLYLEGDMARKAESVVTLRSLEHPWYYDVSKFSENKNEIDKDDIWHELGINDRTKRTPYAASEISKIMTKLGFENKQIRINNARRYVWKRKQKKEYFDEVEF